MTSDEACTAGHQDRLPGVGAERRKAEQPRDSAGARVGGEQQRVQPPQRCLQRGLETNLDIGLRPEPLQNIPDTVELLENSPESFAENSAIFPRVAARVSLGEES